ncbi:MAG: hypothetical protein K2Q34_01250 [Alphaproteobacteria bacterium]|nr:hypothetical protein [Alphaproteobacteria bacterium]
MRLSVPDHPLPLEHSLALAGMAHPYLDFLSLSLTAICVVFLLAVHWAVPRLRKLNIFDESILNSITGGIALGYILLHVLPSLMLNLDELREETYSNFLGNEKNFTFLIFMFVLLGFLTLYILEKLAHDKTKNGQESSQITYIAHVGTLTYLNLTIALMMPAMANESLSALMVFTFIMGLHFVLQDHSMSHHFPKLFDELGRYIIMVGIVVGWLIGIFLLPHTHTISATLMYAFLAGALILGTVKIEFSLFEGHSHFPTFIASLSAEAAISFIILLLETIG